MAASGGRTHHAGYRARLVECLADDYPAMKCAMGDEAFEATCVAYLTGILRGRRA